MSAHLDMPSLSVPPPSERRALPGRDSARDDALRLLADHRSLMAALSKRSSADFRLLPVVAHERDALLAAALMAQGVVRPTLLTELAPLLAPRVEVLLQHLRQRLARTRELTPVGRVRELDTACLRHAARRPGRTLIEKAGARQELLAVKRLPRFDTMENRVARWVSERLVAGAKDELRLVGREHRRVEPRAKDLARLRRAATALVEHPDLAGVGAPKPGERPSNALLGDSNYRALWRTGRLLRTEEERFQQEWAALATLWSELVLAATWEAVARIPGAVAVPSWTRVTQDRPTAAQTRVELSALRSWVIERGDQALVVEVALALGAVELRCARFPSDETVCQRIPTGLTVGERLSAEGVPHVTALSARFVAWKALRALQLMPTPHARVAMPEQLQAERASLCAMATALVCANDGNEAAAVGPTAALTLSCEGEAPLVVRGEAATWGADPVGPHDLHRSQAKLLGQLLAPHRGRRDTAVVVPEAFGEVALRELVGVLGSAWFVRSSVAAALCAAEAYPARFPVRADGPRFLAVVVATAASLDVAVLEETTDADQPSERLWVRSPPLTQEMPGLQRRALPEDEALGAWLRDPDAAGWTLVTGADARRLEPVAQRSRPALVDDVKAALRRWTGQAPTALLTVGLSKADALAVGVNGPHLALPEEALAAGGHAFLARHASGLPTWKDRLPTLDVETREGKVGRRASVSVVPKGQLVAPGQRLDFVSADTFVIPPGQEHVSFRLRVDNRPAPFEVLLHGAPLPLHEPVSVKIKLAYEHGRQGISGFLVPEARGVFERVAFDLQTAGESSEASAPMALPALRFKSVSKQELRELVDACEAVPAALNELDAAKRKQSAKLAGIADEVLMPKLDVVKRLAKRLECSDHAALDDEARATLERASKPLDWLLGVKRGWTGVAPQLGKAELPALQARAALLVRGDGFVAEQLASRRYKCDETVRLRLLSRLVDGRTDSIWDALVDADVSKPHLVGTWGRSVALSIRRHSGVAAGLDEDVAARILAQAVDGAERLAEQDAHRYKQHLYGVLLAVMYVCQVRSRGLLSADDPRVRLAGERLTALRERLPPEVLAFGGTDNAAQGDQPIAAAIEFLAGRYSALPSVEEG